MTYSNLSKIKTKFRTEGQITGNWGKSKVRTNGNSELGLTTKENISITRKSDYINRMYQVLDTTTDRKIQEFAYTEIRKYLIQTNQW
jgi:hypothetical protein